MDRKLIWTEKASGDIEAIVRYIARRDPSAAARIGLGIYDRAQILLQHPGAGTILDELREGGWHKLIFRRWKIVYTIRGADIIIGRIWPAAMGEADMETPL
jgi:plasmid stabilization system protein ParE